MTSTALAPLPPASMTHSPPFLTWPVSRREFYRAIWVAMIPSLIWGIVLFGIRPLSMLIACALATTFTHVLLKRILKWHRGQSLVYAHCLVSAIVMVSLAHPTWPAWILACFALLLPLLLALLGGPGRERIHLAVLMVAATQFLILPQIAPFTYAGKPDAILAHDRIVMGDIRDQHGQASSLLSWPSSRDLSGNDAVPFTPPALVAVQTLDQISDVLPSRPTGQPDLISPSQEKSIRGILDDSIALRLPSMDLFMLGISPNRIGAASLIGVTFAGLYLSYRYILRPRSVLLYLVTFILASAAFIFTPPTLFRAGSPAVWELVSRFPGEIYTLLNFLVLNSDAPFAAVIILALPGAEPLTPRGRRLFLIFAAVLAAWLHRLWPSIPAASFVLTAFMPLAPIFDDLFAKRSWLNERLP